MRKMTRVRKRKRESIIEWRNGEGLEYSPMNEMVKGKKDNHLFDSN